MMSKVKQPPKSPSPTKAKKEPRHWSHRVNEVVVSAGPDGLLNLVVQGGAENGQFCYIGEIKQDKVNYHSGKLHQDEIILEIQGRKVSGYTLRDLLDFLKDVSKNGAIVMFKTIKSGEYRHPKRCTFCVTRYATVDRDCLSGVLLYSLLAPSARKLTRIPD